MSIFRTESGCTIPTPDARKGLAQLSIPVPGKPLELWAIGVVLGVIIRTGIVQDLPFAPLVWKFVAGERIGADDVTEVDSELKGFLDAVLRGEVAANWSVANWAGRVVGLPGMQAGRQVAPDEVQRYVDAVIEFRIRAIRPALRAIRSGFRDNVGFKRDPFVTGRILALAAEGSPVISIDFLKSVTVVEGFPGGPTNPYVLRFWRVASQFGDEDRRKLLRFITTLTRIPNTAMCPDFHLQIDPMNAREPDIMMPTASTCFNLLHLPRYSNDAAASNKILYAIRAGTTMENE
jgi:hypothetical protein